LGGVRARALLLLTVLGAATASAQDARRTPPPEPEPDLDALYEEGRRLFEELAPPEVKARYEFPSRKQVDDFVGRLQRALETEDLRPLAAFAPEARAALAALRLFPELADQSDWLAERLDYAEAAGQALRRPPPAPVPPARVPAPAPGVRPVAPPPAVPHYDLWLARVRGRPVPPRAAALLPTVQAAFRAEGVPPALAWLAEAESTFNPRAVSPVGAKGLFQLMPPTARELGLSTFLPDERTDPAKSARAAARYLRQLHARFGDWPLALAAYNAGPGRIGRALERRRGRTFADIAPALPAETRMYVPKVLALLATRAGVAPGTLPPPR
jgi:membrane-bound lytic murein transglycosylase D